MRGSKEPRRGHELNQLSIIPDGSLLVRDGVLVEVGSSRRVENLAEARSAIEVSAVGRVVMPGFVDSHTHLLTPPPGTGVCESEGGARALHGITGMRLKARARVCLESMARHGTTTVEVKTGCASDESAELKILRVLAELQHEPLDVVASILFRLPAGNATDTPETAWRWVSEEFLPKIRRRRLAAFADVVWDNDWQDARHDRFSPQAGLARYFEAARGLGLGTKVHADQPTPSSAVRLGVEHRAVSVDHLEHATEADAALLGRGQSIATLLPGASFHSGRPFAPARALIDAGAPVALATDFNSHHSPTLSMQAIVALACLRMEMTPAEAISAATINGAHALSCAARVGSLEYGKSADLLILNASDYRDVAHSLGVNLVHMTIKHGEWIYQEGEVAPRSAEDLRPAW